jgi:hypothetical protein
MGACEHGNDPFGSKWALRRKILDWLSEFCFFKNNTGHGGPGI